jgi:hypothetical protein
MTRVRVEGFTISLDGYGAGPNQDIRNPLEGIDLRALAYECFQFVASEKATHVVLRRQGHNDA